MLEYDLLQAENLNKALDYLKKYDRIKMIAGGTDILVDIHNQDIKNEEMDYLLDISRLQELKEIKKDEDWLEIGSLVTHSDIMENEIINSEYRVLSQAAETIGSTQIRNRGTIGGNIVNASPAADLLPPLIALEAEVVVKSSTTERTLSIPEFVTGPYRTDIKNDEILKSVRIPVTDEPFYSNFQKIGRRQAVTIARLNTAVAAKVDENKRFYDTHIVPGSATPSPQAFSGVEEMVNNTSIDEIDLEKAGEKAAEEMVEITGTRWSTPYKKPAISTLVKRALEAVIKEVESNE